MLRWARLPSLVVCIWLMASLVRAFDFANDYTTCDQLAPQLLVSSDEVASTSGVVITLSYSRNVSDAALYNTTVAWSTFRPYNSLRDPASFLAPNRYYVNQSLHDAANASWLLPYPERYMTPAHLSAWLYSTDEANRTYAKQGPQSPNENIAHFTAAMHCELYLYENGTHTGYTPSRSIAADAQRQREARDKQRTIALGLGIGLGLFGALLIVLLAWLLYERRKRRSRREAASTSAEAGDWESSAVKGSAETPDQSASSSMPPTHQMHRQTLPSTVMTIPIAEDPDRILEAPPPTYAEANKTFMSS